MFHDRKEAGIKLAEALRAYKNAPNTLALAVARGGVVVGYEVARRLGLPLDVIVPRKIGAPENPEYAVGAITETGDAILNEEEVRHIDRAALNEIMSREKQEARRRMRAYHPAGICRSGLHSAVDDQSVSGLAGKTVIIVDDGLATGYTMRAAIASAKSQVPDKIVAAIPHGAADSLAQIRREADEVVVLETPATYFAVGAHYALFPQITDDEVLALLKTENNA